MGSDLGPMTICFHGTSRENYNLIRDCGFFNAWTWFAQHLEDAVGYGGEYVFEITFPKSGVPDHWQFLIRERLALEGKLVRVKRYDVVGVYEDAGLAEKVLQSNRLLDMSDSGKES